jgi:Tol biopolymer transport system component
LYLAKMDDVNNPKNLTTARVGFAFTPDGRIVYEGNDGDIWSINREGGEQRQLTNSPSKDMYPRVSSDGRYIFFMSNRSGSNQVWRINSDGTSQMQITKHEGGGPRFVTPDGKWVYFLSELHQNLWRVSADGDGQETEVLNEMILEPAFSPDGTLVAYLFHPKDNRTRIDLAVMALADGKTLKTITQVNGQSHMVVVTWATDNKALFYVTTDGSQNLVWRQSLDDENPTLFGELGNDEIAHLSSSPDGSSIAFIRGRWIHDAVLIEGLR